MKTTIDNSQRVFLVTRTGMNASKHIFCNLNEIPAAVENMGTEAFKVSEFYNGKFGRISKKSLNEMLEANQIDFRLK